MLHMFEAAVQKGFLQSLLFTMHYWLYYLASFSPSPPASYVHPQSGVKISEDSVEDVLGLIMGPAR